MGPQSLGKNGWPVHNTDATIFSLGPSPIQPHFCLDLDPSDQIFGMHVYTQNLLCQILLSCQRDNFLI